MPHARTGRTTKIWRNGELINWADATIHVISHVVHYGSSVFEGVRCYETPGGGAIFRARDHMRRLLDSCKIYRMPIKYSLDDLVQAMGDTVAANDLRECYLRPLVIRTGEHLGVAPGTAPVEVFIIAWAAGVHAANDAGERGLDAKISSWRRPAPDTIPMMAKAGGNYLNSQLTNMEARQDSYGEGIMLDTFGFVSEGAAENLFAVRNGTLYTSPIGAGILQGITRDSIMRIATDLGIPVREQNMPREFLYVADELFFCGTAVEVVPVFSVDRIPVGDARRGPITTTVQKEYLDIVRGRIADRHGWLTMVPEPVGAGR